MLEFQAILSTQDKLFPEMYRLYKSSFPPEERRDIGDLERELTHADNFHINALMKNEQLVGLFNYWIFDTFYFLEHFAVSTDLRGQNLGSNALNQFIVKTGDFPIVFEVEMPHTDTSSRRINFYERMGFWVVPKDYAQPPYQKTGFLVPMLLMTNNTHFVNTHFDKIRKTLYKEVYHYKPNFE